MSGRGKPRKQKQSTQQPSHSKRLKVKDEEREEAKENINEVNKLKEESDSSEQEKDENMDDEEVKEDDLLTDEEQEKKDDGPKRTLFQGIRTAGMYVPLIYNQRIKAIDHLLVILARAVRYNNSYECIIAELRWIKLCFKFINIPTTKTALWKILGRDQSNLVCRLYCTQCTTKIGKDSKPARQCVCEKCGPGLSEKDVGTFIQIRLRPQLRDLLNIPNIVESLRHRFTRMKTNPENLQDIYDGDKYKDLNLPGNFLSNPNNFSLTIWTDRIHITKSIVAQPVLLQVNELAPRDRKKHLILAGIWIGNEKPVLGSILSPIVRDLEILYNEGIDWKPDGVTQVTSKFITTIFTASSIVRSEALKIEENCCSFCLAPGPSQSIENKSQFADRNGVAFSTTIPAFNVVVNSCQDLFMEITKRFFEIIHDGKGKPYYIGGNLKKINERFGKVKTPSIISRPKSLALYKNWKADEWRNWVLYFSLPCLEGILPSPFFENWSKFARAMFILNNSTISEDDLKTAKILLRDFVIEFEQFGIEDIHLLGHVVQCVRNWGPLWIYSDFRFNAFNEKFIADITSPHRRADQVVSRFFMRKFIEVATSELNVASETREHIERLLNRSISNGHQERTVRRSFFGEGAEKSRHPTNKEIEILKGAKLSVNKNTMVGFFKKAKIQGIDYQDEDGKEFLNVVYCRNKFWTISSIFSYRNEGVVISGIIGKQLKDGGGAFETKHVRKVTASEVAAFLSSDEVIQPGITIKVEGKVFAVSLSNPWEMD